MKLEWGARWGCGVSRLLYVRGCGWDCAVGGERDQGVPRGRGRPPYKFFTASYSLRARLWVGLRGWRGAGPGGPARARAPAVQILHGFLLYVRGCGWDCAVGGERDQGVPRGRGRPPYKFFTASYFTCAAVGGTARLAGSGTRGSRAGGGARRTNSSRLLTCAAWVGLRGWRGAGAGGARRTNSSRLTYVRGCGWDCAVGGERDQGVPRGRGRPPYKFFTASYLTCAAVGGTARLAGSGTGGPARAGAPAVQILHGFLPYVRGCGWDCAVGGERDQGVPRGRGARRTNSSRLLTCAVLGGTERLAGSGTRGSRAGGGARRTNSSPLAKRDIWRGREI